MKNFDLFLDAVIDIKYRISALEKMNISEKGWNRLHYHLIESEAIFSFLPSKNRHDLSHAKDDIIVSCTYHNLPCDDKFKLLLTSEFLNCYVFTGFEKKLYPVGIEQGLSLILKENEDSWTEFYSEGSNIHSTKGLRVAIHEPHTIPNLFDNSLELIPGHSTTVSLQQINVERINTPKSKCMSTSWIDTKYFAAQDFRSTSYSCLLQCEIKYVWDRCGCKAKLIPEMHPLDESNDQSLCIFLSDNTDLLSVEEMLRKFNCELKTIEELNTIKEAEIHPPCVEQCDWDCNSIQYSTDVTSSQWPLSTEVSHFLHLYVLQNSNQFNIDYLNILRQVYNVSSDQDYDEDDTFKFFDAIRLSMKVLEPSANTSSIVNELRAKSKSIKMVPDINPRHINLTSVKEAEIKWVQDSFHRLNIYFKEPVVQVHRQVLDYSAADFWSSLGGILGLWAGVSIITVIELLEFLAHLLRVVSKKACSAGTGISSIQMITPVMEKNT